MADETERSKAVRKPAKRAKPGMAGSKPRARKRPKAAGNRPQSHPGDRSLIDRLTGFAEELTADLAGGALRLAVRAGSVPLQAFLGAPANPDLAREAGASLRELRELAGLTRSELADAMELSDGSLLKAVENGTAALSFDLILRLASILARHDPVPFVTRYTRTYSPELWRLLESWGISRLPLQFEREREFINVYRRRDAARNLSDEGFARVLDFTRSAFEMSLHFVAEQEQVADRELEVED